MVSRTRSLRTPLCDLLGCEWPILLAGMGGVARHRLASAVSRAGGFGVLGMVREPPERIDLEIEAMRGEGVDNFAVNLIPAATEATLLKAQVDLCIRKGVPWMALFWDVDYPLIRHLKAEGIRVIHQVGHRRDAEQALLAGADILIAQGYEAGGHVRSETGILPLLAELVPLSPAPVVASGGIADGRGLAAALCMGAQGVSLGSAFLATHESNAHDHHKFRLLHARAEDTVHTRRFDRNWHEAAPVRVLSNRVTRGEYDDLKANDIAEIIGEQDGQPIYLFSTDSPLLGATGELDDMALYAGQSCSMINTLISAEQRMQSLIDEAWGTLRGPR